ncbi:MAG: hypothetical protein KF892_08450 [Rhizobacter sp.]|nr:hypothetical protein [Rhizobacter sp.]
MSAHAKRPRRPQVDAPSNSAEATARQARRRVIKRQSEEQTDGSDASDDSADDSSFNHAAERASWNRPSGQNSAEYLEWETWSQRRWAWEFLRRNDKFQDACDERWDDQRTIAQDFHITEFKHYRQEYAAGKKPKFAAGIHSIPRRADFVENNERSMDLVQVRATLSPSEVFIKFQLAPTRLAMKTSIDFQLEQARRRLESFARHLREAKPPHAKGKHMTVQRFDRAWLLASIRILDLKESAPKLNLRKAAETLLEDPYGPISNRFISNKKLSDQGGALLDRATTLADCEYLKVYFGKLKKAE